VVKYGELSPAPWFGLPMCDPNSYPQNTCTPDSDTNTGLNKSASDAGSAFMELQLYPPGFAPFMDSVSCSATQWCAAVTIDSLECTFNFATCNNNCIEPFNFAYLQTNGVPAGPPAPQDPNLATFTGDGNTLKMNAGDVLKVFISDPTAGFTTTIEDLTTGQTGTMVASAGNGFANTSMADCSGTPFTFHAEYSSAKKKNQVPWAALEGGVLMQQEIGHFESCTSVTHKDGFSETLGTDTYSDPRVFQSCSRGEEGKKDKGEGPCNAAGTSCQNATTQGLKGPKACSTKDSTTGALCEFSDGFCFPKGNRTVMLNGTAATENYPVAGCTENQFQNGDLDFDGISYQRDWPSGDKNFPTSFRYVGPFTGGNTYPQIQFQTNTAASENLCNVTTGKRCTAPPISATFYPFWSLNNKSALKGIAKTGVCVWNFGNKHKGVTKTAFSEDKQYGKPDVARFGGTLASKKLPNPELASGCAALTAF
jgi:hypothetical protein